MEALRGPVGKQLLAVAEDVIAVEPPAGLRLPVAAEDRAGHDLEGLPALLPVALAQDDSLDLAVLIQEPGKRGSTVAEQLASRLCRQPLVEGLRVEAGTLTGVG